jgi:hypothetical protein
MDQLRAQLGNYLEWLESRGLTGSVAFRVPESMPVKPEAAAVEAPAALPHESQQSDAKLQNTEPARPSLALASRPAQGVGEEI